MSEERERRGDYAALGREIGALRERVALAEKMGADNRDEIIEVRREVAENTAITMQVGMKADRIETQVTAIATSTQAIVEIYGTSKLGYMLLINSGKLAAGALLIYAIAKAAVQAIMSGIFPPK